MITLEKMYEAQANSPATKILGELSATATRVQVEDASVLPGKVPFLLTLGFDKAASETVCVTAVSENTLDIVRGVDGNAMIWMPGTKCARVMTAKDLNDLQANVTKLNEQKQDQATEIGLLKCTAKGKLEKAVPGEDYAEKAVEAIAYQVKEKKWKITFTDGVTELIDGPSIPTKMSEMEEDNTHRTVSDTEKAAWNGKSDSAHTHGAASITSGTFGGQVNAAKGWQDPAAFLLRNSRMADKMSNPNVNGEVVIGYDGEKSRVMVNGTSCIAGMMGNSVARKTLHYGDSENVSFEAINDLDYLLIEVHYSDGMGYHAYAWQIIDAYEAQDVHNGYPLVFMFPSGYAATLYIYNDRITISQSAHNVSITNVTGFVLM